jgi:Beta-propeller repeat
MRKCIAKCSSASGDRDRMRRKRHLSTGRGAGSARSRVALGLLAASATLAVAGGGVAGGGALRFAPGAEYTVQNVPLSMATERVAATAPVAGATKRNVLAAYGRLPLAFVPNAGQLDPRVRYAAQQSGVSVFFTRGEAVVAFGKGRKGTAVALRFLGARPAAIEGRRPGTSKVNYLLGSDPRGWRTGLPTFGQVVYRNLWPGVDMVFRGADGRLKYEFILHPGAKVADIRLAYRGGGRLSVDKLGDLLIPTRLGTLRDGHPRSYQQIGGRRVPIASRFALAGGRSFRFALGARYEHHYPLVIDPGLLYSTFLGGSGYEEGHAIAVDAAGDAYVTGRSDSANFPSSLGAFDTGQNGGPDAFVSKLNPDGSALLYSTFLGGSNYEDGLGIAVDTAGDAYVTGRTKSANFPTSAGAFDISHTSPNGGEDAYVTALNPGGSALVYSTFLGGSSTINDGLAIAVDGAGDAYVTGDTQSLNFPTTPGAFDSSPNGAADTFVTKIDAAGSALLYSTYLGGTNYDFGLGIAVDGVGDAYVTGLTDSANFPTSAGAFDTSQNGGQDAYVTKLNTDGSTLIYSTFLGGSSSDVGLGIALDTADDAYVTGYTDSTNFPTSAGAFDTSQNGGDDAFMTKLDSAGSALVYSTYLGGRGFEEGEGIAVDSSGSAYVAGYTESTNFPSASPLQVANSGGGDAFVTKLDRPGTDATPPAIAVAPGPNDHVAASGWYNQATSGSDGVEIDVSATDPSGVSNITCTDGATTVLNTSSASGSFTLTDGMHSISCTATDGQGNSGAGPGSTAMPVTFNVDETAPTVTVTPGRAADSNGWYNHAVSFTASGDDNGGSGNVSCDAAKSYSGPDNATASVSLSCTDGAGNRASGSFGFQYDATPPLITVAVPTNNTPTYLLNQPVTSSYRCTDSLSGVQSCADSRGGTMTSPGAVETSSVGANKKFTITATDKAGNPSTVDRPYQVTYKIKQLSNPTTGQPTVVIQLWDYNNVNKSSSAIAVTAVCVVPAGATSCGASPIRSLNSPFTYASVQKAYTYTVDKTGLTKGTQYNLLFTAQNDPVVHAATFKA